MKKLMRELFFLKRGELRALFFVGFILLLSLAIRIYIPRQKYKESIVDEVFMDKMDLLRRKIDSMNGARKSISESYYSTVKDLNPFPFDPNTVTETALKEMNFPSRVLSNLMSYRRAGGEFSAPEDMRKIYGMDSVTFKTIESFIHIERREHKQIAVTVEYTREEKSPVLMFELNEADSTELVMISGIGPVFSVRIIKYRKLLGAYYNMEQLWEVYGMDSVKYLSLKDALIIDTTHFQKIDINTASFKKMVSHPYLNGKEVRSLIHYREYAGEINDLAELRSAGVLDSLRYEQIRPYLKCKTPQSTLRKQSVPSYKTNFY